MKFSEAVLAFKSANPWLGDNEAPAVATLEALAVALDAEAIPTPALVAQFGLTYRNLAKAAPVADTAVDPLEAALPA
ncbi:hypothetical protein SAMN06309944_0159 [Micrococcales bacterium KH10]|nr:hypothetical protein SAMN06309944_0159 [Micrococcales bacterium KH10]